MNCEKCGKPMEAASVTLRDIPTPGNHVFHPQCVPSREEVPGPRHYGLVTSHAPEASK